jgi:hypothetical protein
MALYKERLDKITRFIPSTDWAVSFLETDKNWGSSRESVQQGDH